MPPKVWTSTFVGSDPVQDPTPIDQPGVFEALVFSDVSDPTQANALAKKVDACARLLGDKNNSPTKSICDILNRNHSTGDAQHVRYYNASDPTPVANKGFSYVKAGEFYYRDSSGNIVQITSVGKGLAGTLKESGGTLLPVGAVADGQLLARVGAAIVGRMKCNLSASSDPGVGDDSDDDYGVGSIWVNTSATPTPDAFICLNPSVGAAVWEQINGGGSATSPLTTKGQLWGHNGTVDAAVPAPASDGLVATSDSTEATGIKWSSPVSSRGAFVSAIDDVVTDIRTVSSAAWADIDAVFEQTRIVPVTGTYRLTMSVRNVYSTSSYSEAFFRVLLDGSTAIGPGDEGWGVFCHETASRNGGLFSAEIDLTAGSHTFKAQWWRAAVSVGNPRLDTNGGGITVDLMLVSGSSAGGVLDPNKHVQSANRTITATSLSAVPTEPMSVTFSTGANETVRVGCHVQGYSATGTNTAFVQLRLDGTLIGNIVKGVIAGSTWEFPLNDSFDVKITDAGSHTLELYAATASSQQWQIVAGSWIDVDQYRGGYANMDSVLAKTADFNIEPEDSHRTYNNSGASGTVIGTLPAWELGLEYKFSVLAAQTFRVLTDSTSDNIRIAGSVTAGASRYAEANTIGNTLTIRAVHGNVWLAFASNGTWTLST